MTLKTIVMRPFDVVVIVNTKSDVAKTLPVKARSQLPTLWETGQLFANGWDTPPLHARSQNLRVRIPSIFHMFRFFAPEPWCSLMTTLLSLLGYPTPDIQMNTITSSQHSAHSAFQLRLSSKQWNNLAHESSWIIIWSRIPTRVKITRWSSMQILRLKMIFLLFGFCWCWNVKSCVSLFLLLVNSSWCTRRFSCAFEHFIRHVCCTSRM